MTTTQQQLFPDKSIWTLRERVDEKWRDYLSATRFMGTMVVDVPLHVGPICSQKFVMYAAVRREREDVEHGWRPSSNNHSSKDDDDNSYETEETDVTPTSTTKQQRSENDAMTRSSGGVRATIGAALSHGGREALRVVTLGTVGRLDVDLDVTLFDSTGAEIKAQHGVILNPTSSFEFDFELAPNSWANLRIQLASHSTIHALKIYAVLLLQDAQEDEGIGGVSSSSSQSSSSRPTSHEGQQQQQQRDDEGDEGIISKPTMLIRKALFGISHHHPLSSSFIRSFGSSVVFAGCGVVIGMAPRELISDDGVYFLLVVVLTAWLLRVSVVIAAGMLRS